MRGLLLLSASRKARKYWAVNEWVDSSFRVLAMVCAATIMWEVVEEHLEEAAYLWTQWERALIAPNYTLQEMAERVEERLLANIDGLVVAGEAADERLVLPALEGDEPGKVFAAAFALLKRPASDGPKQVIGQLGINPELDAILVRALELTHRKGLEEPLLEIVRSRDVARAGSALEVLAFRQVPVPLDLLKPLLAKDNPSILPAALRAARLAGERVIPLVEFAYRSPIAAARDAAVETGLVLGMRSALLVCQELVEARKPDAAFPLLVLALGGDPADLDRIIEALRTEPLRPAALFALGFTGRSRGAEECLGWLGNDKVARVAGEAFSAITGLAIEGEYTRKEEAEKEEPIPFEDEDLDEPIVVGPEAALPLPDPSPVTAWWAKSKGGLEAAARYAGGRPLSSEALLETFKIASCRRRRPLGLDLAIRTHGEYVVETRTWARAQLQAQPERQLMGRPGFMWPYSKLLRT